MKRLLYFMLIVMLAVILCGCGKDSDIIGAWELSHTELRKTGSEGVLSEDMAPAESGASIVYHFGKDGYYEATADTEDGVSRTETGKYTINDSYLNIVTDDSEVTGIWRVDGDTLVLVIGESEDNATMYFDRID